jgi:RNA polymerase sigma factor (sigma-70 family)
MNDGELFAAWRGGDRASGESLIERHYDAMLRFFRGKAGDHAEDLVQRTFLVCAEPGGGFRGEGSFRAYLFGVARNVLFEHIRRRVRDGQPQPDFAESSIMDLAPGVATVVGRRAEQRLLMQALNLLPLESQLLIELYYWEELAVDELAAVLEIPAGTVKSRLHSARARLRDAMEQLPAAPEDTRSVRALLDSWLLQVRPAID